VALNYMRDARRSSRWRKRGSAPRVGPRPLLPDQIDKRNSVFVGLRIPWSGGPLICSWPGCPRRDPCNLRRGLLPARRRVDGREGIAVQRTGCRPTNIVRSWRELRTETAANRHRRPNELRTIAAAFLVPRMRPQNGRSTDGLKFQKYYSVLIAPSVAMNHGG
jgi:hypothetical protein